MGKTVFIGMFDVCSYAVFSSAFANGNITLDVLPVKGPQGPPLRAAEPSLKVG